MDITSKINKKLNKELEKIDMVEIKIYLIN
jgi:hypothetical protein